MKNGVIFCTIICFITLVLVGILLWRVEVCSCKQTEKFSKNLPYLNVSAYTMVEGTGTVLITTDFKEYSKIADVPFGQNPDEWMGYFWSGAMKPQWKNRTLIIRIPDPNVVDIQLNDVSVPINKVKTDSSGSYYVVSRL